MNANLKQYVGRFVLTMTLVLSPLAFVHETSANEESITKLARFEKDGHVGHGVVKGNRIHEIEGDFYGDRKMTGRSYALSNVTLLAPTQPSKVLGVALNYRSHVGQTGETEIPETLQLFYKSPSSVIGPGDDIVIPQGAENVHYESEMVAVIGRRAKEISVSEAPHHVLGVTCGNDVTARDWQSTDMQWWRAKGADTFAPCGPVVASGLDHQNLDIEIRLNGQREQKSNTSYMVRDVAKVVSFVSHYVTLQPGDLIYTGATGITSRIEEGDTVEVEIEGIGTLRNPVVDEE